MMKPQGNIYIFTLIVMMTVFIGFASILALTNNQVNVSAAYSEYAALNQTLASAQQQTERLLNQLLYEVYAEAQQDALENLSASPWDLYATYHTDDLAAPYSGSYQLSHPESGVQAYQKFFNENIHEKIQRLLQQQFGQDAAGTFHYLCPIPDADAFFEVQVTLQPQNTAYVTQISVTDPQKKQQKQKTGVFQCDLAGIEYASFTYQWNAEPVWATSGAYAGETVALHENVSGTYQENMPSAVGAAIALSNKEWRKDNAVIAVHKDAYAIDVSAFYIDGTPIPTILIQSGGSLNLYASDANKNLFYGIAYAKGPLSVENISSIGGLISERDIHIRSDTPVSIQGLANCLFEVAIESPEWERQLMDFFGAANFGKIRQKDTLLSEILTHVEVSGLRSLEISGSAPAFQWFPAPINTE